MRAGCRAERKALLTGFELDTQTQISDLFIYLKMIVPYPDHLAQTQSCSDTGEVALTLLKWVTKSLKLPSPETGNGNK